MKNLRITGIAVATLGMLGLAWTCPANAVEKQNAEDGGVFAMPAGDFREAASTQTQPDLPRRSATPDADLMRIKGVHAAVGGSSTIVPERTVQSQALFTECVTNAGTGSAPSDIHGAASPTSIVVVTNRDISVRNKTTCALISGVSFKTFFNNFTFPATESLFDPRVVYDRTHGRCIVSVESRNTAAGNTDQFLYLAASLNNTCTTWRRIRFTLSRASTGARFCKAASADFYDYPSIGYIANRLVVTANVFPATGGYGTIMSVNLPALLGTATVNAACFRTGLPTNIQPAIAVGAVSQMYLLSPGSGSGNSIRRLRLNASTTAPTSDTLTTNLANISVPAWTAPPDATQPNGQNVDTLDGRFQSATKQIGTTLWNVHAVNVGGFSRFRLYKFSTIGNAPLFTFTPTTNTCSNVDDLFNPSVDTNSTTAGSLAFVTASRTCQSQAVAGRPAHLIFRGNNSSSAGWVFTTVETSTTNFATENGFACNTASPPTKTRNSCRWGDYSATQIDPVATTRAWGFNQLATGATSFDWNTRAGLVGP